MKGMALGGDVEGYAYEDESQAVPLWAETKITLRRNYHGKTFTGQIYTIENISGKRMVFNEKEFQNFGDEVAAIALARLNLEHGETTYLYIVRRPAEAM